MFMFYYDDETDGIVDMTDNVYLFENEKAYLDWYFEEETVYDVINMIISSNDKNNFIKETMHDGVKKLSNGMFVKIML